MIFDFGWIADPAAWAGLGTLTIIEIVLGIDNLVFISILASRLPEGQKQKAFSLGLSLALLMRLALLCGIAWIVSLTQPLLTLWGHGFSARDLILVVGGVFLLLKGTVELHERLEAHTTYADPQAPKAVFWHVVAQILVLDAIFSLDSVITSVGMVKHLPVMMLAVTIAMLTMLVAARPLTRFVERHPTVIVLCLGFLLMIGLSLLLDGFGVDVPKGYLYAAIGFSVLVEAFNQWTLRNRRGRITPKNLRESTARAVLALLGGKGEGAGQLDVAALASRAEGQELFAPEERDILVRVLRLGGRSARYVMTPRHRMVFLQDSASWSDMAAVAAHCSFPVLPVYSRATDEISGVINLVALLGKHAEMPEEEPQILMEALLSPAPFVFEHTSLPDLLEVLRSDAASLALVQDEYGSVVGMVTAADIVQALSGQGDSVACVARQQADGVWFLPGSLPIDEVQHVLGKHFETSAATLAGLILDIRGHIPVLGEEWYGSGFCWRIRSMDKTRIDMVEVVKDNSGV